MSAVAVAVTGVAAVTVPVGTVTVKADTFAGTVTVAGTVRAELLVTNPTTKPAAGAGPFSRTVSLTVPPEITVVADVVRLFNFVGTTVILTVLITPSFDAVTVMIWLAVT